MERNIVKFDTRYMYNICIVSCSFLFAFHIKLNICLRGDSQKSAFPVQFCNFRNLFIDFLYTYSTLRSFSKGYKRTLRKCFSEKKESTFNVEFASYHGQRFRIGKGYWNILRLHVSVNRIAMFFFKFNVDVNDYLFFEILQLPNISL